MIDVSVLDRLLGILWEQYKKDCPYAKTAEELFPGSLIDHIAFRSVYSGYKTGIVPIEEFWNHFGYVRKQQYDIPSKNIFAIHMEHPRPEFPKIFISEFVTENLREEDQSFVRNAFGDLRRNVFQVGNSDTKLDGTLSLEILPAEELANFFLLNTFPIPPTEEELKKLEKISQYLAWVRLFGNRVNHFTLLVNSLSVSIFHVYSKMKEGGIPMKKDIEGEGTELAQTSTESSLLKVAIHTGSGEIAYKKWPYDYYEIAERGQTLFTGFKAEQTKGLFDMTGRKK